ncbi:MAG: ATP-binding protein [Candidatus Eisenbacteria bacterium]|nr:ATP-binding protein [Candidatus Eisenbacteria bacterium]
MRSLQRDLARALERAAKAFPAVVLSGPRRSGKTWLLRHLFPKGSYVLLEDPDVVTRFRADPQRFLDELPTPAILDEIQNVPEAFAYVRSRIDRRPRRTGQYFLTGSQDAPLMRGVTESMAGRAAVFQLLPFSARESKRGNPHVGGFPEVIARPRSAALWFSSYVQTYLERDVRAVTAVRDLSTFRRFLGLVAARHGQTLNRSDLAAPLGVTIPTVSQWLSILETTAQVLIVPPYFENFGKRLVKSPKIYLADSGLACHLLGIANQAELRRSPFLGPIFEGFVASEIAKSQANRGARRELYYFRDHQGLEVDFVVPAPRDGLRLIECKATRTPLPGMTSSLHQLHAAARAAFPRKRLELLLVHDPGARASEARTAISPGVRALAWPDFTRELE